MLQQLFPLTKIDFQDNTKQVAVAKVDLGFGMKYDIKELKKANKVTDAEGLNFKCGVIQLLASLCKHAAEKSLINSYFARCIRCLSPNYMVE